MRILVDYFQKECKADLKSSADILCARNECDGVFLVAYNTESFAYSLYAVAKFNKNLSEIINAKEIMLKWTNEFNGKGGGSSRYAEGVGQTNIIPDNNKEKRSLMENIWKEFEKLVSKSQEEIIILKGTFPEEKISDDETTKIINMIVSMERKLIKLETAIKDEHREYKQQLNKIIKSIEDGLPNFMKRI